MHINNDIISQSTFCDLARDRYFGGIEGNDRIGILLP